MSKFELTFATLRTANRLRLPQFKNAKGLPAHSEPDGSDWPLDAWSNAALGELGEAANLIKKLRRGDLALNDYIIDSDGQRSKTVRQCLADELADVVTYVDILALQIDVSLGDAVATKFNENSKRVGADVEIDAAEVGLILPEEVVPRVALHTGGRLVLHSLD